MNPDLTGHVAVVTGGGRGIGRTIAERLAEQGASVLVAARTECEIEETVALINGSGGSARAARCDVSNENEVQALFETVQKQFGQLDILINNAGVGLYGPIDDFSSDDFDQVLFVNLKGVFLCCREAMRLMVPRERGWIINISSVVGFKGYPNQGAYTAAKHGVMGLTKVLAVEAQEHGIRVSAVLPGGVATDMVRKARPDLDPLELLAPEDVAHTVAYLLSLSERAAVDQIYIRRRNSSPF